MGSDFSLAVCFGLAWESLTEVFVQRIFHLAETIKLFPFKYAGSQRVVYWLICEATTQGGGTGFSLVG